MGGRESADRRGREARGGEELGVEEHAVVVVAYGDQQREGGGVAAADDGDGLGVPSPDLQKPTVPPTPTTATPPPDPPPAVDPPPVADPPPEVKPDVPKALPKGSVAALAKKLRKCLKNVSLSSKYYEVNLDWRTDDAGHIDDCSVALATIQPQPIPTGLKDCITETVVASEFAWKPARKYKELVPIGTPPPPTDGAG